MQYSLYNCLLIFSNRKNPYRSFLFIDIIKKTDVLGLRMIKSQLIILTSLSVIMMGCSSHQAQQLGFQDSSVNSYARHMSNSQLCATYLGERSTNQTRVSLAAEWQHRKLSHAYCSELENEWYLTKFTKWLMNEKAAKPK